MTSDIPRTESKANEKNVFCDWWERAGRIGMLCRVYFMENIFNTLTRFIGASIYTNSGLNQNIQSGTRLTQKASPRG